MTRDELIEKMAFGIAAYFGANDHPSDAAKAALAEIESAGYVVVPKEPTDKISSTIAKIDWDGEGAAAIYAAIIAASPLSPGGGK